MPKKSGIQEAVDLFDGSPTAMAKAVGGEITRQNIETWLSAGYVPVPKCPRIAIATGVPVMRLNPLHNWAEVRQSLEIGA